MAPVSAGREAADPATVGSAVPPGGAGLRRLAAAAGWVRRSAVAGLEPLFDEATEAAFHRSWTASGRRLANDWSLAFLGVRSLPVTPACSPRPFGEQC